ncbi:20326_t:CDS:2, partial [Gigaspora margarita]
DRNLIFYDMFEASTTDSIYESSNIENFFSAYDFGNPESLYDAFDSRNLETFFNTFGSGNMEYFLNTFDPNNSETFFEPINDKRDNKAIQHTENPSKLDKWFNSHGLENGFAFMITYSKKDKEDGIPRRRTYKCTKDRLYVSRKEAHVVKDHNSEASNVKERKGVRKCGICNSKGHNARTCPSLAESYISDDSEENNSEDNSEENDPENNSEENNSEAEETNTKRNVGLVI